MKSIVTLGPLLVLTMVLGTLPSCGGGSSVSDTVSKWFGIQSSSELDLGEDAPQTLARQAQERMDADDYDEAATLWSQLKDQYPYSEYGTLAELKLGDALYYQEKYIEALAAYEDFERLHPANHAVPYAIYQQGMCYYEQIHGVDRDQQPTISAIQTFGRLVEMYPRSQYTAAGHARIAEAMNILAGHEFYVGKFYYERKDYAAAVGRFMGLLKYYPNSGYHQQALNYIAEYKQLVADGVVEDAVNQRDDIYESPFLAEINDPSQFNSSL